MSPDAGWAGHEGPVTGGAAATPAHVYHVRNRAELAHALRAGGREPASAVPKLIEIEGVIDLSVDEHNRPLSEADYRDPQFSWDAYARDYDPSVWGKKPPVGAQEEARKRSAERQAAVVVLAVGSNTTVIGIGRGPAIKNGSLLVKDAHNVIIRNIAFADAYDYFPAWDPNDNAQGEWNAAYDNVTLYNARRVWVDQCSFSDGARPDRINRTLLGRPMQFHDGLLDIVRGSDLVTVSRTHFHDHDKGVLIGNSDSRSDDEGKLRVTMHSNWFEDVKERSPRVRYGRVHLYNNLYSANPVAAYPYGYSIGVGFKSRIIAENNAFELAPDARPFKWWKGERVQAMGNVRLAPPTGEAGERRAMALVDPGPGTPIDAGAMLDRQAPTALLREAGWTVPYPYQLRSPASVRIGARAGAGSQP